MCLIKSQILLHIVKFVKYNKEYAISLLFFPVFATVPSKNTVSDGTNINNEEKSNIPLFEEDCSTKVLRGKFSLVHEAASLLSTSEDLSSTLASESELLILSDRFLDNMVF